MGLLGWLVFGALAGWVASEIVGVRERRGCLRNVVTGIVGAFLGGILHELATGRGVGFGWNLRAFGVAVLGAVLLLVLTSRGGRGGA